MEPDDRSALMESDPHAEPQAQALAQAGALVPAGSIFSAPITVGPYTIITASTVAGGSGFGSGFRRMLPGMDGTAGGLGGGGGTAGRPVAVIILGPDGVTVQPIVDVTRIAMSALVVAGLVALCWRRR
ncbi:hypothetical protein [Herpetosiphon sp. NSE202]|uniref:hypothetical protein n=1 Tax=Herpetosiphon sp. NSE202 TaxID=3351349 RepID=UPI00362AC9C8